MSQLDKHKAVVARNNSKLFTAKHRKHRYSKLKSRKTKFFINESLHQQQQTFYEFAVSA